MRHSASVSEKVTSIWGKPLTKQILDPSKYAIWRQLVAKWDTGGRLNKKDGLTRYGDSHVKDKTS